MNIPFELAVELRDAGYVFIRNGIEWDGTEVNYPLWEPTLSELIEACGDNFLKLTNFSSGELATWRADGNEEINNAPDWGYSMGGATPEIAVARLYLALNKP